MEKFEYLVLTRTTEKQDVAVHVLEFESTQTIMRVLEWFRKLDVVTRLLTRADCMTHFNARV
jgi:hypothetical protein